MLLNYLVLIYMLIKYSLNIVFLKLRQTKIRLLSLKSLKRL